MTVAVTNDPVSRNISCTSNLRDMLRYPKVSIYGIRLVAIKFLQP